MITANVQKWADYCNKILIILFFCNGLHVYFRFVLASFRLKLVENFCKAHLNGLLS